MGFEPTSFPTKYPTINPTPVPTMPPTPVPTVPPTMVPTMPPTMHPTVYPTMPPTTMHPTLHPTLEPTKYADAGTMAPTDLTCRDYGPNPCPDDIVLLKHHTEGVTALPRDSFRIISQDTSSVTVQFNQKYDMSVPYMFY